MLEIALVDALGEIVPNEALAAALCVSLKPAAGLKWKGPRGHPQVLPAKGGKVLSAV